MSKKKKKVMYNLDSMFIRGIYVFDIIHVVYIFDIICMAYTFGHYVHGIHMYMYMFLTLYSWYICFGYYVYDICV
jgi:hypothetical protein